MKPALTAEEWEQVEWHLWSDLCLIHLENRLALAAISLYGQPFGFTREDLTVLRECAESLSLEQAWPWIDGLEAETEETTGIGAAARRFQSIVDRIEALLPPAE